MRSYLGAARTLTASIDNTALAVLRRALFVVRERKNSIMEKKFVCPTCQKGFDAEKGLKTHITRMHVTPSVPIREISPEPSPAAPAPVPAPEELPDTQSAVPEVTPPAPPPAPPAEVPCPAPVQPPSITKGSAILLAGPTWWQNPGSLQWEAAVADKLVVVVVSKEVVGDDIMLMCRAEGGNALWAVQEKAVLEGKVKLVRLAPAVSGTAEMARPPDGPRKVEDPPFDYFEEERKKKEIEAAREAERKGYEAALERYVAARAAAKSAKVAFDEADKDCRPVLWPYIERWGKPSAPGKNDFQVIEFGWKGHIVRSVQPVTIRRDRAKIIAWLLQNGQSQALTHDVNLPEWEKLKLSGAVPAEFIREVEQPEQEPDKLSLRVDPA